MDLKPLPGYALVRLKKLESGLKTEKEKYAVRSEGTLISFMIEYGEKDVFVVEGKAVKIPDYYNSMKNKTVYFAPFEDGEPVKVKDEEYVFLPVKEIRGVNHAEA